MGGGSCLEVHPVLFGASRARRGAITSMSQVVHARDRDQVRVSVTVTGDRTDVLVIRERLVALGTWDDPSEDAPSITITYIPCLATQAERDSLHAVLAGVGVPVDQLFQNGALDKEALYAFTLGYDRDDQVDCAAKALAAKLQLA